MRSLSLLPLLALTIACRHEVDTGRPYHGPVIDDVDTEQIVDTAGDSGDTSQDSATDSSTDSVADTGDTGTPPVLDITVTHAAPWGEVDYPATSGRAQVYFGFIIENPNTAAVILTGLTVSVHGNVDAASRHQVCELHGDNDDLSENIIEVVSDDSQSVTFGDEVFFGQIIQPNGGTMYMSVNCLRDPTLGVPESGEMYSLDIDNSNQVRITDIDYNRLSNVRTQNEDGVAGHVNDDSLFTWVSYFP